MRFQQTLRLLLTLGIAVLFFGLAAITLAQGPDLVALPTATPVVITPADDPAPDSIDISALPDLVVTGIETAAPVLDEPTLISVTIKNQGGPLSCSGTSPNNFNVIYNGYTSL